MTLGPVALGYRPPKHGTSHRLLNTNGIRTGLNESAISIRSTADKQSCSRQSDPRLRAQDTLLALLKRLSDKFGLLFDLDLVARNEHRQDGDTLRLEEPATRLVVSSTGDTSYS